MGIEIVCSIIKDLILCTYTSINFLLIFREICNRACISNFYFLICDCEYWCWMLKMFADNLRILFIFYVIHVVLIQFNTRKKKREKENLFGEHPNTFVFCLSLYTFYKYTIMCFVYLHYGRYTRFYIQCSVITTGLFSSLGSIIHYSS